MSSSVTLVTGSSGFIGRVLMAGLAAMKRRAVGLDPRPSATTHVADDLSDRSRLRRLLLDRELTRF